MKRRFNIFKAGVLCLSAFLGAFSASAQEKIYYFETNNGEIYFSDTPEVGFVEYGATKVTQKQAEVIEEAINRYANLYALDPLLIRAIIKAESNYNPTAESPKGAQGLMQIMPVTARHLGLANPFDPSENIRAGSNYLSTLLKRFKGDLKLALAAYNAGPGNVDNYGGIPPFNETITYIQRVLMYYQQPKPYS